MAESTECRLDRERLFDLYRIAIDEYHFNVKLSWDRTRFYVGLNAVLVTAGSAVMRFHYDPELLLILMSTIGLLVCVLGIQTVRNGHN